MTDADAKAFMNATGCNGCHALDESRIGPRLRDVSRRYRAAQDGALPRLVAKIRYGGAGAWGLVPMIANPRLTAQDAQDIAAWILALPAEAP
ncbi:MAG TPA: c-type cytochrome [Gammaproteobacteria bacterium]|nr:c-type cytochrome [Gammaproteobacteria bacterium]